MSFLTWFILTCDFWLRMINFFQLNKGASIFQIIIPDLPIQKD